LDRDRLINARLKPSNTRHQSKREVEWLVAALHPQPDVPTVIRRLPARHPAALPAPQSEARVVGVEADATVPVEPPRAMPTSARPEVTPLTPDRYKIQFTVSRQTRDKLRRAQDLLRHAVPDGDPAIIFDRALTILLTQLERSKTGATDRPRTTGPGTSRRANVASRHVPAATQRVVWQRDGGRCAFTGPQERCTATAFLEYHHVVPFAAGGETSANNLELRCRAHNRYEVDRYFGRSRVPIVREARAVYGDRELVFSNESALGGSGLREAAGLPHRRINFAQICSW
jgi:hypothetical protein